MFQDHRCVKRGISSQECQLWQFASAQDYDNPMHREWTQLRVHVDQRALREKEWGFLERKVGDFVF